jgi:hypothetical protein
MKLRAKFIVSTILLGSLMPFGTRAADCTAWIRKNSSGEKSDITSIKCLDGEYCSQIETLFLKNKKFNILLILDLKEETAHMSVKNLGADSFVEFGVIDPDREATVKRSRFIDLGKSMDCSARKPFVLEESFESADSHINSSIENLVAKSGTYEILGSFSVELSR